MTVVAIVPAYNREDRIGATVAALGRVRSVDRLLVVDDGSTDRTAEVAREAGADVLVLSRNRGKGGAVAAGVEATPDAAIYLLIDADLEDTAAEAERLIDPVRSDEADMTIGVLPPADGKAGFGLIKRLARWGTARGSDGFAPTAPLSGQRALRASLLRELSSAERFGLEVALNIDAARAGARVVEVEVPMDHRHTGRSLSGFAHRGRQGVDIVRALWPRLVPQRVRAGLTVLAVVLVSAAMLVTSDAVVPDSSASGGPAGQVVLVGVPHWGLDDIETGLTPAIDDLARNGALAAMSVRTLSGSPTAVEAYTTINAGARVRARSSVADAYETDAPLEGSTAGEVTERRTGRDPDGDIVVPIVAAAIDGAGSDLPSEPGALGDALDDAGIDVAVVGTADYRTLDGDLERSRPTPAAVMTSAGGVDSGRIDPGLLSEDPAAPWGLRADLDEVLDATRSAIDIGAGVIVVDPGDTDRAGRYAPLVSEDQAEAQRRAALQSVDSFVASLAPTLDDDTLLLVVGLTPPTRTWELTPMVASGAGVLPGYIHSTSTKRLGLVTLTDLPPTILDSLGVATPDGMIGVPFRYHAGEVDVAALRSQNEVATGREGVYFPMALTFIIVQALGYLFTILVLSQGVKDSRLHAFLRIMVLSFAAWPLATFILRAVPVSYDLGGWTQTLVIGLSIAIGVVSLRARRHALSPLAWIAGITAALLIVDVSTGANLQMSSVLGYSPHTAARFTGFGNTAFAVLAATAVLVAAIHVNYAPRRRDALLTAAGFLVVVVIADGAPTLGSDVGGILTLVPVFGLLLFAMSGRKVSARTVVIAGLATLVVLGIVAGLDLLRGEGNRTHLGDFVAGAFDGDGTFWTTISRKWATNLRVFQNTIWTWMVPITAVFLTYVLVISKGWRRLLPEGSPLRAGIIACLAAGVLGWLVNDSGVVVTALVFVYAGPYLTLLALAGEEEPARLLRAGTASDSESTGDLVGAST